MIGARGFLKREGFDFDKKPHQIDRAFLKLFSAEEAERIRQIWDQIHMFGASPTKLYAVPKTLQQAHMLMSYDRDRYIAGFEWIRRRLEAISPRSVLEVGTGTGVLLRYLASNFSNIQYTGIDAEAALINAAPSVSNIRLLVGDYLAADMGDHFDLIICNFGFDADNFPESNTPHSIDQVGSSQFCPGCSDDLALHLQTYFRAWRSFASEDCTLLLVGRIASFGFLRAVVVAAEREGWLLQLKSCDVLAVRDSDHRIQKFPALQFRAGADGAPKPDIEEVEQFLVLS